jgi:hypothetical protein
VYSATAFVIRPARLYDVPALAQLGWTDQNCWPDGPILVGEIRGEVGAALAIEENRAVIAALPGAPRLLAQMRARAAALQASWRTPSVADRIRARMRTSDDSG